MVRGRTHDDAVAERGPVLELQGLEHVPELLRHGCRSCWLALLRVVAEVEVQSAEAAACCSARPPPIQAAVV